MIQSITFGDKNTWDDWHILPKERPVFAPPKVKTHYIDIPGGDGSLDLSESLAGYPTYENREGSFTFRVMNGYGNWADRYSEIADYLHGHSMRAVLADDPQWFYQGRFNLESWKSGNTWSEITIGYSVGPYKQSILTSTEDWKWDPFNFETGIMLNEIFANISIDSDVSVVKAFDAAYFGSAPIIPEIIFTDASARKTGLYIGFKNDYLGINETQYFKEGTTSVPNFIFYGQKEPYQLTFRGHGTVSIKFRQGRL